MDEDNFALVDKILKDIENILLKHNDLISFEIVPVDLNFQNKSPVLLFENSLGIESWCVKHVYMFCHSGLLFNPKKKALKPFVDDDRLIRLLNVSLLLNPEFSTLWNKRRELVLNNLLGIKFELKFSKLVLSRKPKCNDAFSYRRWILDKVLKDPTVHNVEIEDIVTSELQICEMTSDRSPNNYHSWSHRMWLINKLKHAPSCCEINTIYVQEYSFAEKWSSQHISDYSCYHYKQYCIKNIICYDDFNWDGLLKMFTTDLHQKFIHILECLISKVILNTGVDLKSYKDNELLEYLMSDVYKSCNCSVDSLLICRRFELLFYELVLNNEQIKFYKHHETLWYHRRFIFNEILLIIYEFYGLVRQQEVLVSHDCKKCNLQEIRPKNVKILKSDGNRMYSSLLFKILIYQEQNLIEERKNDGDNYAVRHETYLKLIQGLNDI